MAKIEQSRKPAVLKPQNLKQLIFSRTQKWVAAAIDPIYFILYATVLYAVFLGGDRLILFLITLSFGDTIKQIAIVDSLFEGIQIFSALGIAVGYLIHTTYLLYQGAKHLSEASEESKEEKK